MALEHYSASVVREVRSTLYSAERPDKPKGFWVSVPGDDDWPSWCRGEQWGLDELAVRHQVALAATANILLIDSLDALDALDREFAALSYPDVPGLERHTSPDWKVIRLLWDGIIIAPYQWARRLGSRCRWYYGWDCASGCIWNADAIAAVNHLETSAGADA